jgi:hypothetical protein
MAEKLVGVDLRLPVGVFGLAWMLSVWLGIHGGLSVRLAGHPRLARRGVALTAGAPLSRRFRLDGGFSAELLPAVRRSS